MLNRIQHMRTAFLLAAVLAVGADAFVLSPILSEVAQGLATEPFRIAWSISAFGGATALSALALGGLTDRFSVGPVLGIASLLLAAAQVLSGVSQGWIWLCVSQGLAGLAAGVILPGSYATAAATAPRGREAARLGLVLTGWALSLTLAVPLAAFVAERLGWRVVYFMLAGLSVVIGFGLVLVVRVPRNGTVRTQPWRAYQVPGVALLLIVTFAYTSAFYGSFAFFGEGLRQAFGLSAEETGLFVLAYGLGFGVAGIGLGIVAPRIGRGYFVLVMLALAASYASWGLVFKASAAAFLAAIIWGALNQVGLNALVVSLNRRAGDARGAVMGLNTAVTYSAVFAGPVAMSPIYAGAGFATVSLAAAMLVMVGALIGWISI